MFVNYKLYVTEEAMVGRVVDGVTVSGTHYSKIFGPKNRVGFGLTVITTGTLTGTWTLWATDKPNPSEANDNDWVDMSTHADFVETNPAGAATKWRVNSTLLIGKWFRLKYVNSGGAGSIFAYVTTD